jgi:hypothetical protein
MKVIRLIVLCAACVASVSCAGLAGTSLSFGEKGELTIMPPKAPIVIPVK